MNLFQNWKQCVETPGFLKREGNVWTNPLGEVVVSMEKPECPTGYKQWALVAFYREGYEGDLIYSLQACVLDESVGELSDQLATVLKLDLPKNIAVDVYVVGEFGIEDSGEGSLYLIVGDTEIAELWVDPDSKYGFDSDLLDGPSLDYLYNAVGSITDVNSPERSQTGWK
ncbi:hypothetical protein pEaSNUABM54_00135 [Erwinia phage pEa_SNUABM_54]|nr:hypothetical protein pEaSNUABM54_00135 [Erwinia phage pEa_SNUABM_54]